MIICQAVSGVIQLTALQSALGTSAGKGIDDTSVKSNTLPFRLNRIGLQQMG